MGRAIFKPHEYQSLGIDRAYYEKNLAILLWMGAGKSAITLFAIRRLIRIKKLKKFLIVAPLKPAVMSWPNECKKWRGLKILNPIVLHSSWDTKWHKNMYSDEYNIHIINPQGLSRYLKVQEEFGKIDYDMMIVDESTMAANMSSIQSKNLYHISKDIERRIILTASFVSESLIQIAGQWRLIDPKKYGKSQSEVKYLFKEVYFHQVGKPAWDQWTPKKDSYENIMEDISDKTLVLDQNQYQKLPPVTYNNIEIDLPKNTMDLYREYEEEFFINLDKEDIFALSSASLSVGLQQLSNGAIYYRDMLDQANSNNPPKGWKLFHNEKLEMLKDMIEYNPNPVLVAYKFKHDKERLKKLFGSNITFLEGNAKQLDKIQKDWNDNKIKILAAYPATSALGLNLQESRCKDIVWISTGWTQRDYTQFNARVWRQGMASKHLTIHHLVAKNTIDELILSTIHEKKMNEARFLDVLKSYKKKVEVITA